MELKTKEKQEGKGLLQTTIKMISEELEVDEHIIKSNIGLIMKDKAE